MRVKILEYWLLFLAGFAFIVARNFEPYIYLTMYAEDGTWAGRGLVDGWVHTLFHARGEYLVALNIFFLWLATKLSAFFTGSVLEGLPFFTTLISAVFYTGVALTSYLGTERLIPKWHRVFLFFLIILFPAGISHNEIFGKIAQIGFFLPFISAFLLAFRAGQESIYIKILIDLALLSSVATNPICAVIIFIFAFFDFLQNRNIRETLKSYSATCIISVIYILLFVEKSSGSPAIKGVFEHEKAIEAVVARGSIYPIIFPWYTSLTDIHAIIILILSMAVMGYALKLSYKTERFQILASLVFSYLAFLTITFVMRPGLTNFLDSYRVTIPDRYFAGVNILFMAALFISISIITIYKKNIIGFVGQWAIACVCTLYIYNLPFIITKTSPGSRVYYGTNFYEAMCSAKLAGRYSVIQIVPKGWSMKAPTSELRCRYPKANVTQQ